MLMQRVLTAIVLIPIVLWLIFFANNNLFLGFAFLVLAIMSWEWARLISNINTITRLGMASLLIVGSLSFVYLLALTFPEVEEPVSLSYRLIPVGASLFLLLAFIALVAYPKGIRFWSHPFILFIFGILYMGLFVFAVLLIKCGGGLLYLLLIVWAADIGAYFVGKAWGKHRLIPNVSPGKSWEGLCGGLIASVLTYLALVGWSLESIYVPISLALVSVEGDLLISMLKRQQGLKDTGAILPGHGGILDRIDSLIPAAIVYMTASMLA